MDLLGSILGSMDAPPMSQSDKEAIKKAKGIILLFISCFKVRDKRSTHTNTVYICNETKKDRRK